MPIYGIRGADITAGDFRTWSGTVDDSAAEGGRQGDLRRDGQKAIRMAIQEVAAWLGNTPTICRNAIFTRPPSRSITLPEMSCALSPASADAQPVRGRAGGIASGSRRARAKSTDCGLIYYRKRTRRRPRRNEITCNIIASESGFITCGVQSSTRST